MTFIILKVACYSFSLGHKQKFYVQPKSRHYIVTKACLALSFIQFMISLKILLALLGKDRCQIRILLWILSNTHRDVVALKEFESIVLSVDVDYAHDWLTCHSLFFTHINTSVIDHKFCVPCPWTHLSRACIHMHVRENLRVWFLIILPSTFRSLKQKNTHATWTSLRLQWWVFQILD